MGLDATINTQLQRTIMSSLSQTDMHRGQKAHPITLLSAPFIRSSAHLRCMAPLLPAAGPRNNIILSGSATETNTAEIIYDQRPCHQTVHPPTSAEVLKWTTPFVLVNQIYMQDMAWLRDS